MANSGARRLWIRRLREEAPVIVEMNTSNPFFSPNGDWLGFFGSGLMKVPTAGGTPQLIAVTTERNAGATWGRDGTIVFATTEGLFRVAENGGEPELLKRPDPLRKERLYAWPEFMPDGQSVLFTVIPEASTDRAQIAVLNLRTRESKIVLNDATAARYAATGHLLYVSGQSLNTIAFDRNVLETRGEAIVVPDTAIATAVDNGAAEFAVSATGTLLFIAPRARHSADGVVGRSTRRERAARARARARPVQLPADFSGRNPRSARHVQQRQSRYLDLESRAAEPDEVNDRFDRGHAAAVDAGQPQRVFRFEPGGNVRHLLAGGGRSLRSQSGVCR